MRSTFDSARMLLCILLALAAPLWPGSNPSANASVHARSNVSIDDRNRDYFTDLKVITHEGKELRFYSDILKDKIVAITFFYVNCPTAQMSLATFFKLQKMLGERLGKEFMLVTVSVDPAKDTPEAVRDYARRFNPMEGWLFVTGKEKDMEIINQRLGNTGRLPEGHARLFLLGNLRTGHWMKIPDDAHEFSLERGLNSLVEEDS